ncbi:MAG TPA: sugar phosphate isomerase/epimerase family protein [Vicinamibacterales bacterium]|nr:sugar phosphate isomerase/epimerase family protein [Vicinamibacterales bacterium]
MRFGISTHLYHQQRLGPAHLRELAEFGFTDIELFASIGHFDYRDPGAGAELAGWLTDAGLTLHSVHAPIVEHVRGTDWGPALSNATSDEQARARAVGEVRSALQLARTVPFRYLVVHLGITASPGEPNANSRAAAERSLAEIAEAAAEVGVRVALEVIPNALSTPQALARLIEEDLEAPAGQGVGICLDTGHAFLQGDLADAIDLLAGDLVTTHVHDNRGKADDHLVPFEGRIDWPTAVMTLQKVGYEGLYLLELANTSTPREVLQKSVDARRRLEDIVA